MPFCMNCGQQLPEGAKFCSGCGTAMGEVKSEETQRKQEWAGKIIKCPSCGEDIPSFTAICPACGHEINSAKVSSSLKNFIDSIDECDRVIANNPCPDKKSGWSSWGTAKRVFWVILNVLFFCLPLIIYLYVKLFSVIIPLARYDSTPKLTADEKRKASLIENFPFPNERESILEALLFIKAKISFLASEKIDKKNAYWIRLWSAKASQLYQKAEMMFRGDKAANEAYQEILKQKERVRKIVKFKAIIYTIVLIAIIIIFFIRNGTFDNIKVANTPVDIPETELSVLMPQIEGGKGEVTTNNSEYFTVTYYGISESEFEAYKKDCKNCGFTIDCKNTGSLFDAFNEDGYNIRITYYSSEMHITVSDNIKMHTITWPNSEVANLLPAPKSNYGNISTSRDTCLIMYVGNMTIDDYSEYVNECINKGFSEDMSQTDDHYHADNAEGYHVLVEYRGYNTVFIRIDD